MDFFEVPKPSFVMSLVVGGDLMDYLEKNGALNRRDSIIVLRGIGEGLQHLHAHNLAHRDLKSPNVLIRVPSMEPVLIDLGLGA